MAESPERCAEGGGFPSWLFITDIANHRASMRQLAMIVHAFSFCRIGGNLPVQIKTTAKVDKNNELCKFHRVFYNHNTYYCDFLSPPFFRLKR